MDTLLAWTHALAWAVYVGGSITMEWVLRYAQRTMPPSQVSIVCKRSGSRYRWVGLAALGAIGLTGALMVARLNGDVLSTRPGRPELSLTDAYGQTLALLSLLWVLLVAASASMAFWLHPAQARRSRPEMSQDEIQVERQRVGRAIARMDHVLKFELVASVISIALGASLNAGGLV